MQVGYLRVSWQTIVALVISITKGTDLAFEALTKIQPSGDAPPFQRRKVRMSIQTIVVMQQFQHGSLTAMQ